MGEVIGLIESGDDDADADRRKDRVRDHPDVAQRVSGDLALDVLDGQGVIGSRGARPLVRDFAERGHTLDLTFSLAHAALPKKPLWLEAMIGGTLPV